MLLPDKHIRIAESFLGLGAFVLATLDEEQSIDDIWAQFESVNNTTQYPAYHTFDNLLIAVAFLYTIGSVRMTDQGLISRCG